MNTKRILNRMEEVLSSQNYGFVIQEIAFVNDKTDDREVVGYIHHLIFKPEIKRTKNTWFINFTYRDKVPVPYFKLDCMYINNTEYYSIPESLENKCIELMTEVINNPENNQQVTYEDNKKKIFSFQFNGF